MITIINVFTYYYNAFFDIIKTLKVQDFPGFQGYLHIMMHVLYRIVSNCIEMAFFLTFFSLKLIQFCTCRNAVIKDDEVKCFFSLVVVKHGAKHSVGLNTHHSSRRKIGDRYGCLSD